MDNTYAQGGQPDNWDIWRWVSYATTGASIISLFSEGKGGKEIGRAGTIVGLVSSALHAVTEPPRCSRCRCRMARLQAGPPYTWWCQVCRYGKA